MRNDTDVTGLKISMQVLLVLTSALLVPLVLLHKGKGGGLSDMFGGGITSSAGSSGVAERNLNRITVGVALTWAGVIVVLGLIERYDG
ncbi:Protein-export membrane protein SecG OS=Cellulomonas persica OX=76861 GN=CPE01_05780 PE=3 SV=1 [Cellulomonas persica]